jgi:hypothetical protein
MGGDRRQKVLLGVLAAVALAALLKFTVFNGDDDSPDTATPTSGASGLTFDDGASTTDGIPDTPNTVDVFDGKNPFEPVIQITTPTAPTTTSGTGPTTTTIPGQTTTTTAAPTNNPNANAFTLQSVTRQSTGTYVAIVKIGSTVYEDILEGDYFGPNDSYRFLEGTSDTCGRFQHGDVTFTLCENTTTNK